MAVDVKLGLNLCDVAIPASGGGEGDVFCDAVEGEVSGEFKSAASGFGDFGHGEGGGGELLHSEEVHAFEVRGELLGIGVGAVHLDRDGSAGGRGSVIVEGEVAREIFETAILRSGDFGSGESDG